MTGAATFVSAGVEGCRTYAVVNAVERAVAPMMPMPIVASFQRLLMVSSLLTPD